MRLILLGTALFMAAPALGETVTVVSPIYSQLVALPTPSDFGPGDENEHNGSYILELVPNGQTVEIWAQMITLTGAKGLAATMTPMQAANSLADGYKGACPDTFVGHALPSPNVPGAVTTFSGYLGCGNVDGHSEAMVFLVLQGKSEVYTLQWAERGPAVSAPPEPDPAIWQSRADTLAQARICDKVAGEDAPYPSCTQ